MTGERLLLNWQSLRPRLSRALALHPEWWVMIISALAWYYFLNPGTRACCVALEITDDHGSAWLANLGGWLVMILAMMLPLMIFPIRAAAFNSLWKRRHWAIATFLLTYLAVWAIAGLATHFTFAFLLPAGSVATGWFAAAGLLIAAVWQLTSVKTRLSTACHRTRPLAPGGWRAHRDCLQFGADHGLYCVANCGVLMVAAMASPWHRTMMVIATIVLFYERYRVRPSYWGVALTLLALAAAHCLWAMGKAS